VKAGPLVSDHTGRHAGKKEVWRAYVGGVKEGGVAMLENSEEEEENGSVI